MILDYRTSGIIDFSGLETSTVERLKELVS
jgi:hypothetical protein